MEKIGKSILIIEDEEMMLTALVDSFEKEGFDIIKARDGEEGYIKMLKEKPDVVLLDVILPKLDGLSLLEKVRINSEISDTPIIMLTNLSNPEDVIRAMSSSVRDYLIKTDWTLVEVVQKVKEKLHIK